MEFQSERVPVVDMDLEMLESMAQDGNPEQEMFIVQEQFLPQPNPEPEMGAATAAVCDTSPPPLHQNLPILAESAQPSAPDIAQLCAMLAGLNEKMEANACKMDGIKANTSRMENKMEANLKENAKQIKEEMKDEMEKMRGEMQNMGQSLQAGIMAFASDEMWTARKKNGDATCWDERAGGECNGCQARGGGG